MRILRFIIDGQSISKDPACSFEGLVPGTKGYLKAEFSFSGEWQGCKKAAVFEQLRKEYPVPVIGNACEIPAEALVRSNFSVRVVGERNGYRILTNKVEVRQNG